MTRAKWKKPPSGERNLLISNGFSEPSHLWLTTGVDTTGLLQADVTKLTSTDGNDTFNGLVDYTAGAATTSASTTLNFADTINGGAGVNTLNITVSGAATGPNAGVTLPAASISNIQNINVRGVTGSGQIVTFAAPTGATAVNADRSSDALVFTGLANGASIGNITGSGAVSGTYVAGVTAATLNARSGVTAGLQTITGNADNLLTTLNINSTGAANTLGGVTFATGTGLKTINIAATTNLTTGTIAGMAAATTLNVSGAATTVNVGTLDANVTTVDASGMTAGGITATLGVVTGKVTGGAGNDTITTNSIVLTTGSVNAGAGTADRLIVTAAADVAATPAAKYTGFEIVRAGAFSLDASLFTGSTITGLEVGGAASAFTKMTAGQAANVTAIATATGGTFTLADASGTADVLTVSLTNATAAAVATKINLTTATIDGFETLNVGVNSGIATAMTATVAAATNHDLVTFTSASNLKTINVTGAFDFGVDLANAVKVTTLDLSANTGGGSVILLAANTGALTVTGTAATDLITLSALGAGGTLTVNSGAGNDTITGTQAQVAAVTINGGANTATGDTLALTDTATTIADNTFVNVSGIEKITLGNTTALTWTVGGYANAIATANGGVLDITAASIAAGGTITVDASGLGSGNSLKLSMTNTAGGANAVNITGSASGADNITYTTATSGTGAVTITASGTGGSTAAKTVTYAGGFGTGTITTGAGADTITVGATVTTVTAGAGADTINLAAADGVQQTLTVSAANASPTTGFDRVNNFSTVITNGDVLDFATAAILTTAQLLTGQAGWAVSTGGTTVGMATKTGATLADFIAAFSASTTAGVVAFADGGNTYVGHSDGVATTSTSDQLVMLVGVTGVTGITLSATSVATNISVI